MGIADLCVMAMEEEGTPTEEARSKIFMLDSRGLLAFGRPEGGVDDHPQKKIYGKHHTPMKDLKAMVKEFKPTILLGKL